MKIYLSRVKMLNECNWNEEKLKLYRYFQIGYVENTLFEINLSFKNKIILKDRFFENFFLFK